MSVASVGYIPNSTMPLPSDFRSQVGRHPDVTTVKHEAATVKQDAATVKQPEPELEHEPKKAKPHVIHSTAADMEQVSSLVFSRKLQFVVDQRSNEVIVKVIDKETDKVIKELPPEELQRLHRNVKEVIGFLFDERV